MTMTPTPDLKETVLPPGPPIPTVSGRHVYIVGAGVTGLSAAWKLSREGTPVTVLEAGQTVGGMAATFRHGDFLLDQGPHKFHSVMEDRMKLAEEIMSGEDFLTLPKKSRIRLSGRFLNYPIGLMDVMKNLDPFIAVTGGFSYLLQLIRNLFDRNPDRSYEDWLVRRFGPRLYHLIFAAYARKIWGDPKTLAKELAETRVAIPGLLPLVWQMLFSREKSNLHAETFRYPRHGSGEFSRRLAEQAIENGGQIRLGAPLTRVWTGQGRITKIQIGKNEEIMIRPGDAVVSTLPVGYFCRLLEPAPSPDVLQAAVDLKTRDLILLYLVVNKPRVMEDHWIFFPEDQYLFTRMSEQKNFSPSTAPPDKTCICLEIVAKDESSWRMTDAELFDQAIRNLEDTGLVRRSEVSEFFTKRLKWVYQVYDVDYQKNCGKVLGALDGISNLHSVGRHGGFNYVGQIDCLDIGLITAEHLLKQDTKSSWSKARDRFAHYVVLD